MSIKKSMLLFCAVALSGYSHFSSANLIIHPTRIDFDASARVAEVSLLNSSNKTNTYRVEWVEKKATAVGGYTDLKPEQINRQIIASPMIRYAPRQVTLKPGERQVIKLSLRRPSSLPLGEYRSHLMFKAIPQQTEQAKTDQQGVVMQLSVIPSFAIPVVVRHGSALNYQISVKNAEIIYNEANPEQSKVRVAMSRQGNQSVYGDVIAYWTPTGGSEVELAKTGGFSYWTDLNDVTAQLGWIGSKFALTNGKLRIVYSGIRDFRGKVFVENTFDIQRGQIKTNK